MRTIDADALKESIENIVSDEMKIDDKWATGLRYALKLIDNAPTVPLPDFKEGYKQAIIDGKTNFSRPSGKWVKIFENSFTNGYVCPFCGHKIQVTEQFLPKVTKCEGCGANMRGDRE